MKKIILLVLSLILFQIEVYAQTNNNQISWSSLGIGIHNPSEIKDWTYYGINTPEEASLWIEALRPLGGISYSGAARIWKQNGFSVHEVKEWVIIGAKTPERAKRWTNAGIETAIEVKKWQEIGVTEPWHCELWKRYVDSPEKAKEWMNAGFSLDDVGLEVSKGYSSPTEVHMAQELQKKQVEERTTYDDTTDYMSTTEPTKIIQSNESYAPIQDTFSTEHNETVSDKNGYQVFLLLYFAMMIVTIFKGYGDNRTVIIFRDYNDLGLTFLIPASFLLIYTLFMMFGGNPAWGAGLALIVSLVLFGILVKNTYIDNNRKILPTILSLMTKVPLGIIWIISFMTMLNPSGKTAKERRKNRGSALIIVAILTPIIGMLVVEREGSMFNPKEWIKGKHVGGIRNHL